MHHASTGELGGLWLHRGRPPQQLAGVGFTAQGFDASLPYRLTPAARDPRVAFALEGMPAEGEFGAHGSVLAARPGSSSTALDAELGTPPHALIARHGARVQRRLPGRRRRTSGRPTRSRAAPSRRCVRSDIVFFETAAGGAVFSVGSIA